MKRFLIWVWGMAIVLLLCMGRDCGAVSSNFWYYRESDTQPCRDVEFVFARGSGQVQNTGPTYAEFEKRMAAAAQAVHASYRVTDLDYEAVAIRTDNVLGIYSSAGEAYDFGHSVDTGVSELWRYYNSLSGCNRTHWVLGGYSQGAMVVARALARLESSRVTYVSLFGDPKLYLPEGKGFNPPACRQQNLSSYRVYVPNCDTDDGILGERNPYIPDGFEGLMGLWCNYDDFICGSSKNPLRNGGHSQYVSNGSIYQAAIIIQSRLYDKKPDYVVASSEASPDSEFRLAKTNITKTVSSVVKPEINARTVMIELGAPLMLNVVNEETDLEYRWLINGRQIGEGGLLSDYYFKTPGNYYIDLCASNGEASSCNYVAVYVVQSDLVDDRLPAPATTAIQRNDDSFRVSWTDVPERARYFGIRINDYFLGYSEASNGEMIITDVDFEDIKAGCFWFTEEMDMGYPAEINIERLGDGVGVATSASMGTWQAFAILALPPLGALSLWLLLRLIRDLRAIKNAPKAETLRAYDEKSALPLL